MKLNYRDNLNSRLFHQLYKLALNFKIYEILDYIYTGISEGLVGR